MSQPRFSILRIRRASQWIKPLCCCAALLLAPVLRAQRATPKPPAASGAPTMDYSTVRELKSLTAANDRDRALALVRSIFAALPPSAPNGWNNAESLVEQAEATLKQFGQLDAYIGDTEKLLAAQPDSPSLLYCLAMLCQEDDRVWTTETRLPNNQAAPLWVRLTREGAETVGACSVDGQAWQEVGRASVPLGSAPLAALAAASRQTSPQAANVVMDHVSLTPATPGDPRGGVRPDPSALPVPWREVLLPLEKEKGNAVPPSVWRDGVFTLHAAGWDLWGRYDDVRLVHQPLGAARQFVARIASVEGSQAETKTGVMWRTDLTADSTYAAMIVLPGGGVTYQHRDRPNRATPYWRKLCALQPGEFRYGQALAKNLRARGERDEAVTICDQLIAASPDDMFSSLGNLTSIYGPDRLPELADRLLAWQPRTVSSNGSRSIPTSTFYAVARACAARDQSAKVIDLCRHGIELNTAAGGDSSSVDLYQLLLRALVQQQRPDEAREALLACYLPPVSAGKGRVDLARWMSSTSWNGRDLSLSNLAPLEAASQAELLDPLQTALENRRTENAEQFTQGRLDWLLALVRMQRQDPGVLAELPALLDGESDLDRRDPRFTVAVRLEAAARLRQWPAGRPLALQAFRAAIELAVGTPQISGNYAALPEQISLQMARTELAMGETAAAVARLRELAGTVKTTDPTSRTRRNPDTFRTCVELLLRAGPDADAAYVDLYRQGIKDEQRRKELYFAYGLEKDQRIGDKPFYQAMAWLLDDGGGTGDEATLVYELRARHPYDGDGQGRFPGSRGRSFPGSEGERTLTFSWGKDPEHFAPIGQLKTARTFGTWKGRVPRGGGVLKVTIDGPRAADAAGLAEERAYRESQVVPPAPGSVPPAPAAPGAAPARPAASDYWLRVVRAPNLLANPGFQGLVSHDAQAPFVPLEGWTGASAGSWREDTFESPLPGRPYIQGEVSRNEDQIITGARIPVAAGQSYFQSAWLRSADGGTIRCGRRYLDADGKVLKTSECSDFSTLQWRWHSQRLQPASDDKTIDVIPPQTAFIEPYLRPRGSVAWTGLFVGKAN